MKEEVKYIVLIHKNIKDVNSKHILKCIFYLGGLDKNETNNLFVEKLKDDFINEIEERIISNSFVYEIL